MSGEVAHLNYVVQNVIFYNDFRKEGNAYVNDALNTFYIWLYGVRSMLKDQGDIQTGNLLPQLHGLLFSICSKISFHSQDSTYYSLCYTSHGALAGIRNSSLCPP